MTRIAALFSRLLVTCALLVALAGTGFAHRVAVTDTDPALAAYLLAGGALQDICGDGEETPHRFGAGCDACPLVASTLPPEVAAAWTRPLGHPAGRLGTPQFAQHRGRTPDPAHPARGPPTA